MIPLPPLCAGCPLFAFDKAYTLNEGDGSLGILAVAEAPGEHEADEGRPLSPNGASGKVFRRALRELGIPAQHLTITNILRSRPPDNELRGAPYEREAIDHCSQYLDATVRDTKPRVILALGDVPLRELAAERIGSVTVVRGFMLDSKFDGVKLVSTYHPSYIARGMWSLFGAFKNDIAFAARLARGEVVQLETTYELDPTPERLWEYAGYLRANPVSPVSVDVETESILGLPEPTEWANKKIIQIQFSHRAGYAIVVPWTEPFLPAIFAILAGENPKWTWNGRLSDEIVLNAHGATLGGEWHDLMNAWGHVQPSFWGKDKSDVDGDKGVPSRLMGLQSCTSFYASEVGPWKHLGTPEAITADPSLLPLYGAYDADYTTRCGIGIMRELEALGLMEGYRSHKLDLRPVLDYLGEVGLPVDRTRQAELRSYVQGELTTMQRRMQELVPTEILGIHPKAGYKTLSGKVALEADNPDEKVPLRVILEQYSPSEPPVVIAAGHIGYLTQRDFLDEKEDTLVRRWCIERLYNPHGSSPNTKAYIRHMGYRMPKKIGTDDDTTGKLELAQLAAETGDEVLKLTGEWRERAKVGNDYTGGLWVPGDDGRVHATFRWGTASAQLVAVAPAVMTYPEHSGIAKKAKAAIRAQPGHTLVKIDKRGYHARMAGWLARDEVYYRLADSDVHSFATAHFLKLHDAPFLLDMSDDELRSALTAIKAEHGHTRNYKVKRVVHGVTFGARVKKIYGMYAPNFNPPEADVIADVGDAKWYDWDRERQMREIARRGRHEAQQLIDTLYHLFPKTFVLFPQWVNEQIRNVTPWRLRSPFGHHRIFYDFDLEQATAYLPSNCSHCDFQLGLVRLWRSGALRHFEAINSTHDALWLHPRTELVEECIATVQYEFEKPSDVLVDSPLGPFQCGSDAEMGDDLAYMTAWKG